MRGQNFDLFPWATLNRTVAVRPSDSAVEDSTTLPFIPIYFTRAGGSRIDCQARTSGVGEFWRGRGKGGSVSKGL